MPRLALIQMRVEPGAKHRNLAHALDLIRSAAQDGAEVIVLPEAMPLGWTDPSALSQADEIPDGESCALLRQTAKEHEVYLCSGVVERAGPHRFNSAVLIDPRGEVILHHRKINELEIAHELYAPGDRIQVAPTPWGRVGVMICADGFARDQAIGRALGCLGAGLILSPCAWAVPADHDNHADPYGKLWIDNYGPVARDFRLWIAGVSNVGWITGGPWQGRKCIGCSLVMAPTGQVALQGPYGDSAETILTLDIPAGVSQAQK